MANKLLIIWTTWWSKSENRAPLRDLAAWPVELQINTVRLHSMRIWNGAIQNTLLHCRFMHDKHKVWNKGNTNKFNKNHELAWKLIFNYERYWGTHLSHKMRPPCITIIRHGRGKQATWRPQKQDTYSNTGHWQNTPSAGARGWHPSILRKMA
jgi:hypothetical protein